MIAVRLCGGLGNQMFQYAAARALADRLCADLVFDTRFFDNYNLHSYGLERLSVRGRKATKAELAGWPQWMRVPAKLVKLLGKAAAWYIEPTFSYDPNWTFVGDNVLVDGYFQSEKYFQLISESLRDDFIPAFPLEKKDMLIRDAALSTESVMIHVRRGDYISDERTMRIHGVCTKDYFDRSIRDMREKVNNPRFFVFSNDMSWARNNLDVGADAIYVEGNCDRPEVDVHLMSKCSNHIIANSSFSWWGAWLGSNTHKRVIAPSPWFNDQSIPEIDLIPDGWIRMAK